MWPLPKLFTNQQMMSPHCIQILDLDMNRKLWNSIAECSQQHDERQIPHQEITMQTMFPIHADVLFRALPTHPGGWVGDTRTTSAVSSSFYQLLPIYSSWCSSWQYEWCLQNYTTDMSVSCQGLTRIIPDPKHDWYTPAPGYILFPVLLPLDLQKSPHLYLPIPFQSELQKETSTGL